MKRKKKLNDKLNDTYFYNLSEEFIKIEDKIKFQNEEIIKLENNVNLNFNIEESNFNLNLIIKDNFDFLFNKCKINQKKLFNIYKKILVFNENNKYDFIRHFNFNLKLVEQLKYKYNIYSTTFSEFVDNKINYSYFIGLIKDDNCVPFWNDNIQKISKKLFLPIKENLEELNAPDTFNSNTWFTTKHYTNTNVNDELEEIRIKRDRQFNITYTNNKTGLQEIIIKCKKVKMYLNKEQKKYITQLFGAYRYY